MKRPILFSVSIVAIFSSILIVSCSIGVGQNDETQIYKCHSPHPTRSMIVVNRLSQTSELMAELQITGAPTADSFTIRGPLGVYTTTHGTLQVELEPETMNKFDVTAHFPASVVEMNGSECIWQGSAPNETFVISHSYEDDATPSTQTPTPDPES